VMGDTSWDQWQKDCRYLDGSR